MSGDEERETWIGFAEALSSLENRVGVPEGLISGRLDPSKCLEGEMMWFVDQPIIVHQTPVGVGFVRQEFEAILQKVKRVEHGDA